MNPKGLLTYDQVARKHSAREVVVIEAIQSILSTSNFLFSLYAGNSK